MWLQSTRSSVRNLLFPGTNILRTARLSHNAAGYFNFKRAIVGSQASINEKFAGQSLRINQPREAINIEKAIQQHSVYVAELKKLIPEVVEVPADDRFPDQVYVEEPAVILDGVALLTKMLPESRAGEIGPMRTVLEKMNFQILEMKEPDAFLDGGDVMFTGREFFVGVSERTNQVSVNTIIRVVSLSLGAYYILCGSCALIIMCI